MGGTVSKLEIFFIFLTNLVLVVYLYWLQSRIKLLQRDLWLLLWINLWIIENVNNIIEGYFFTDFVTEASLVFGVLLALVLEGLRSYVAVYLLPRGGISLKVKLLKRLENKGKFMLIFRVLAGSLVYFPIYFLFGSLVSPFILEYYTRTGTGLKIPLFLP